MDYITTEFTVEFEGDQISVSVTVFEKTDYSTYMVKVPGHPEFEIFLSEDYMWVTNDEVDLEEDFIYIIGDTFESLEP